MTVRKAGNFLFIMGVFTYPYYIFSSADNFSQDSGRIQPTHIFFILAGIILVSNNIQLIHKKLYSSGLSYLLLFIAYVIIVNTSLFFDSSHTSPLKYTAFYVFNLFIFIQSIAYMLKASEKNIKLLFNTIFLMLLIQVAFAFLGIGKADTYRTIIFFNNPNQLGYFAILTSSILLIINTEFKYKNKLYFYIGLLLSFILGLYSLSNAAILAFGVLFIIILFQLFTSSSLKSKLYIIILLLFLLALFLYITYYQPELLEKINHRTQKMGSQDDDNLRGRGISKLFDYYQYLVLGAGEGYFERFDPIKEIHSTIPSLIFSYGLIGFSIISLFIYKVLQPKVFINITYLLPVLVYGIAHNGVRSPLLWVILGFISAIHLRRKLNK